MAIDATNADSPQAGYQISGEASRNAAVKRLRKQEQSATPNTGLSLPPRPGVGLVQKPGIETPLKRRT